MNGILLPSLPDYLAMSGLIAGAALMQGLGGVGFAMLSAPVAWMLFPDLVPGPLLALGGLLSAMGWLRERRHVDWRAVVPATLGRLAGAYAATGLLALLPQAALGMAFSVLLLMAVLLSASGRALGESPLSLSCAGLASGLMGTLTSAGASPLVLVLHTGKPARLRATVSAILALGAGVAVALLLRIGRFGPAQLGLCLLLLPALLGGFWLSGRLITKLPGATWRRALLGLTALGALVTFIQSYMRI